MNVLFVSVKGKEPMRIGILKAIGCCKRDILGGIF